MRRNLTWRQRLLYAAVQFYYPSVAAGLLLGNLATAMYLLLGVGSIQLHTLTWLALWSASLGSWFLLWFWLRRFNIAPHEREEFGVPGMAFALFAGPIYVSAAVAALARRPLSYAVTAKGRLKAGASPSTFRLHLGWAAVAAALLAASVLLGHAYLPLRVWSGLTLAASLAPPLLAAGSFVRGRLRRRAPAVVATAPAPAAVDGASAPTVMLPVDGASAPTAVLPVAAAVLPADAGGAGTPTPEAIR